MYTLLIRSVALSILVLSLTSCRKAQHPEVKRYNALVADHAVKPSSLSAEEAAILTSRSRAPGQSASGQEPLDTVWMLKRGAFLLIERPLDDATLLRAIRSFEPQSERARRVIALDELSEAQLDQRFKALLDVERPLLYRAEGAVPLDELARFDAALKRLSVEHRALELLGGGALGQSDRRLWLSSPPRCEEGVASGRPDFDPVISRGGHRLIEHDAALAARPSCELLTLHLLADRKLSATLRHAEIEQLGKGRACLMTPSRAVAGELDWLDEPVRRRREQADLACLEASSVEALLAEIKAPGSLCETLELSTDDEQVTIDEALTRAAELFVAIQRAQALSLSSLPDPLGSSSCR